MMIVSVPPALAWPVKLRLMRFVTAWTGTITALMPFSQQWFPPEKLDVFQPGGHVVSKPSSQYWMNAMPGLESTNCCQPLEFEFGEPLQAEVTKKLELSWSEKLLAGPESVTLVTPVTLSKDPTASDIWPVVTWAETSLPLPTVSGRGPRA